MSEDEEEIITGVVDDDCRSEEDSFTSDTRSGSGHQPPERRTARKSTAAPRRPIRAVRLKRQIVEDEDFDEDSDSDVSYNQHKQMKVSVAGRGRPRRDTVAFGPSLPKRRRPSPNNSAPNVSDHALDNKSINQINNIVVGASSTKSDHEDLVKLYMQEVSTWTAFDELFTETFFMDTCKMCGEEFGTKSNYLTHEPCYSRKRKMRESFINRPTALFDCEVCTEGFDTMIQLERHADMHFTMRYKCNKCICSFDEKDDAESHSETHPQTKAWKCTYPGCGHTYTSRGNISNHISTVHLATTKKKIIMQPKKPLATMKPTQNIDTDPISNVHLATRTQKKTVVQPKKTVVQPKKPLATEVPLKRLATVKPTRKTDPGLEDRLVFEAMFRPWYLGISRWFKCNECDGIELLNSKVVADDNGDHEENVDNRSNTQKSNAYKVHKEKFPDHKPIKLFKCIFTLPQSPETNLATNCERCFTDLNQMRDHIERTHYDQVKKHPTYTKFLYKVIIDHQYMGGKAKLTETNSNVIEAPEESDGEFNNSTTAEKSVKKSKKLVPSSTSSTNPNEKKVEIWQGRKKLKIAFKPSDDIDKEHYDKVSPGSYTRIVLERESYDDMFTRVKKYEQQCSQCKLNFTDVNEYWTHQPCYEERRLERIKKFPKRNYRCENPLCRSIFPDYETVLKHRHRNPHFSCNQCDNWSFTLDLAILHTQVHTNERMYKCIFPGCEPGLKGWDHMAASREHVYEKHIFFDRDKLQCREKDCDLKFVSSRKRTNHEKTSHPIMYYWDDYRWSLSMSDKDDNSGFTTSRGDGDDDSCPSTSSQSVTVTSGSTAVTFSESSIKIGAPKVTDLAKKNKSTAISKITNTIVMPLAEFKALQSAAAATSDVSVIVPEFVGDSKSQEEQRNLWLRQFIKSSPPHEATLKGAMYTVDPFSEKCSLCNKTFRTKVTFIIHKPCYYVRRSKQMMDSGVEEAARYQCDVCELTFQEMDGLKDHMTYHLDPPYKCNFDPANCTMRFPNHEKVRYHIYKKHLNWRQHKCIFDETKCTQTFFSLRPARDHVLANHLKVIQLKCDHPGCDYATNNSGKLKRHIILVHGKGKSFWCPACNYGFVQWVFLFKHTKSKHPDYDATELEQLKAQQPVKIDGLIEVINGVPVVVEKSSYTPLEAAIRP